MVVMSSKLRGSCDGAISFLLYPGLFETVKMSSFAVELPYLCISHLGGQPVGFTVKEIVYIQHVLRLLWHRVNTSVNMSLFSLVFSLEIGKKSPSHTK